MKKISIFLSVVLLMLLCGCGSSYEEYDKVVIKIGTGGTIEETIRDSFDQSYYTQEELISSIEAEVDAYNTGTEGALVELKGCTVKEQTATVEMEYSSAADYAAFNHIGLFQGALSELSQTEYYTNVTMKDKEGGTISLDALIASDDGYKIAVSDLDCILEIKGTICYVSEGVEILSKKAADITIGDEAALAYVIYK